MSRRGILKTLLKTVLPPPIRRRAAAVARDLRSRKVTSLTELDAELAKVEAAFAVSDAEGRKVFDAFHLELPEPLPKDPASAEYAAAVFALYRRVAGRSYSPTNEASDFNLAAAKDSPFPYQTGSATVVGEQLIAQGFLIKTMGLAPGAKVLEFGPGWGNTTLQFLQCGYQVTAVEIEANFVELIRHRCAGYSPTLVHSDMLAFTTSERFDAVVFFECFHHCADHRRLLRQVKEFLRPGGLLVLASEPIADFAQPWCIRLDGQSLWAMRRHGWLELGFDSAYLLGYLEEEGWQVSRFTEPALGSMADVIVARRT